MHDSIISNSSHLICISCEFCAQFQIENNLVYCFQLIPLVVIIGVGGALCTGICLRLATQSPDVTWNRKGNPEPWEKYRNKQYKVCTIWSLFSFSRLKIEIRCASMFNMTNHFLFPFCCYVDFTAVFTKYWLFNPWMSSSRLQKGTWRKQINPFNICCHRINVIAPKTK